MLAATPPSLCADVKPLSVSNRQIAYIPKDSGTSQLSSRRCIFQLPVQRSTSCWCLPGTAADTAVKRFPTLLQTTSLSHQAEAVTHQTDAIMQRPGKVTVLPQICFENHRRTPAEAPNPLQQLKPRGNCRSNSAVFRDETETETLLPPPLPRQPQLTAAPRPRSPPALRPLPLTPHRSPLTRGEARRQGTPYQSGAQRESRHQACHVPRCPAACSRCSCSRYRRLQLRRRRAEPSRVARIGGGGRGGGGGGSGLPPRSGPPRPAPPRPAGPARPRRGLRCVVWSDSDPFSWGRGFVPALGGAWGSRWMAS